MSRASSSAQVDREGARKFPNEKSGLAVGWYAFTRASQIRKFRVPKPRVQRGATP